MKNNYKKLSENQKQNIYGGSAWWAAILPFVLQSVVSSIASIKMLASDNGSVKFNGFQSSWSENKSSSIGIVREYFYNA